MKKIHHTSYLVFVLETHIFFPQLEEKMASPNPKNTNKSHLCGHIVETISTEKYTIMCGGGHVPVHLFPSATDVMFVRFHHGVSASSSFMYMIQLGPRKHSFLRNINQLSDGRRQPSVAKSDFVHSMRRNVSK